MAYEVFHLFKVHRHNVTLCFMAAGLVCVLSGHEPQRALLTNYNKISNKLLIRSRIKVRHEINENLSHGPQ